MNPYYQSLLNDIESMIQEGRFADALRIVTEELSMPYVERDALEELRGRQADCMAHVDVVSKHKEFDLDALIRGSEAQKEKAVSLLKQMNLRLMEREVQTLLDSDLVDEFKGELIEALMEQKIDTPYHVVKDGLDVTFVPGAIIKADEDPSIVEARRLFETWFSNDDPAFCNFCNRLLDQEIYETRPFDFSDLDALPLAKSIVRLVYEAMGQNDELLRFEQANGLEQVENYTLAIEKRGDNHEM